MSGGSVRDREADVHNDLAGALHDVSVIEVALGAAPGVCEPVMFGGLVAARLARARRLAPLTRRPVRRSARETRPTR